MPASRALSLWLPVIVWAAVIFTFSSIPSLGDRASATWDTILRKGAHMTEYAILGLLLLRAIGRELPALAVGIGYAITDELHQHFVRGRHASPIDVLIDTVGLAIGIFVVSGLLRPRPASDTGQVREDGRDRARRARRHAAALERLARRRGTALSFDLAAGPRRAARGPRERRRRSSTRGRSAESATGGRALGRFAEDRAPVYLRPDAEISAALRELAARGDRLGVFTDAPEPLARIAVAQLGADRRIEALETGAGALERLLAKLGQDALVVRDRTALPLQFSAVKENELGDRQLDALLERLDRMNAELHALNRRLDSGEHLAPIVYEIRALGESLQALAYAALGQTAPQVRRRRTG